MKTVTIDELLTWAFVHELPKGGGVDGLDNVNSAWRMLQASSWGKVTAWAELMTTVDAGRRDADNFMIEQGAPHDDALEVGQAVAELAHCDIVVPAGWRPLCDWPSEDPRMGDMIEAATQKAVAMFFERPPSRRASHLVSLVVGTAVLGREPAWDAPVSAIRMVERAGRPAWFVRRTLKDAFGRTHVVEVDGYNGRTHRPQRGAYRRYEFSSSPVGDILSRLDRELWAVALGMLESRLANRLGGHRLSKTQVSRAPWGDIGPRLQLLSRQGAGLKKTA